MISRDLCRKLQLPFLIFLTALTVRCTLAALTYRPTDPYSGEAEYIGASLAQSGEFANCYVIPTGPTAHCGPFYPHVISLVYRLCGQTARAELVRITLLIAVNATCCALIPYAGVALGLPRWTGVAAGFTAAAIPMHRTAELFHAWDEPYAAAGLMLALAGLNTSPGLQEGRARSWAAFGLWWGLLLHIMVTFLPVYLGLAAVDTCTHRTRRRLAGWLIAAGFTALALVPWTLRNRVELGHWVFVRSNLGIELMMSFGDGAGASLKDNLESGRYATLHPDSSQVSATTLRDEGEVMYNRRLTREAVEWVRHHPAQSISLVAARCCMFWFGNWENPETAWIFSLSTILAVVGAYWLWRDGRTTTLLQLGCVVTSFHLVYCVVQHVSRYRMPVWWCVLLLAVYGAGRTWQRLFVSPPLLKGSVSL
jgi:hypothetical protein